MPGQIYAMVSLLGGEARIAALAIWEHLEQRYGARAAREAVHPHLTYAVGVGDASPALIEQLAAAAAATPKLTVTLDGFGLFPGPPPVLYMRIVRDQALFAAFRRIGAAARAGGLELWPHYLPESWVPHCTLALRDMPRDGVPFALRDLGARRMRFRATLADLQLVHVRQPLADSAYVATFPFGGGPGTGDI